MDTQLLHQDKQLTVEEWRFEILRDAGYTKAQARDIAADHTIDLHQATDLLHNGCPPTTAARILL